MMIQNKHVRCAIATGASWRQEAEETRSVAQRAIVCADAIRYKQRYAELRYRDWFASSAGSYIAKEEVNNESRCGLSADRTRRRYRGGQGVCAGGGGPGVRPYCDLRSRPGRCSCRQRTEID